LCDTEVVAWVNMASDCCIDPRLLMRASEDESPFQSTNISFGNFETAENFASEQHPFAESTANVAFENEDFSSGIDWTTGNESRTL